MNGLRTLRATLLAVTLLAAWQGQTAEAPAWEVRYAQLPDQTEAWTALGRTPAWTIKTGAGDEVWLTGDEKGARRGTVLLGRRWVVPATRALAVRLDYQTYCKLSAENMKRSGEVTLMVFTQEAWGKLAETAEQARTLGTGNDAPLWRAPVHPQGEDVTDWKTWEQTVPVGPLRRVAGQTVVLAIVWSAYHFEEEWAKFRKLIVEGVNLEPKQRDALATLRLERPELAAVKAALDQGDRKAAEEAFVAYMKARTQPALPPLAKEASPALLKQADDVLAHVFSLAGCPATKLGAEITWDEDPHNYDQWAIALNRHFHWLTLGRAYAATGDEKYAREFVAQLRGWVESGPIYIGANRIEGPYLETGKSPLSLDAGIRMAQTWWQVYEYFKHSPSFDTAAQMLMFGSLVDHAEYLMDERVWHPESNWGAMEVNGLFTLAVMFPECQGAPAWLETARARLVEALAAQVYPDGAQVELAPGYHGVTLSNFVGALELGRLNQVALAPEFTAGLESMYDYYVAIATPDRRMPAVNDSGWGGIEGMLRQGLTLFPQRGDWRYLAGGGEGSRAPTPVSRSLPWAGWHMMRTGWAAGDKYLFFETGPYSTGHQHEDQLNLLVSVGGKVLLTEGGVYSYDTSDWRRYVLSSRAHNVVLVDGLEQNRRTKRETFRAQEPYASRWFSDDGFDFAAGKYDSGFGPANELNVTHTRQVLFVKPDYWVIVDRFAPGDDRTHVYEALFHFDAPEAEVDATTGAVSVAHAETGLRLIPLGAASPQVRIVSGQKQPVVQGWLPTGRHNELRAIPTAVVRCEAAGPTVMVHVLAPREGGQWSVAQVRAIEALSAAGGVLEITGREGRQDTLLLGTALRLTRAGADGRPESVFELQ